LDYARGEERKWYESHDNAFISKTEALKTKSKKVVLVCDCLKNLMNSLLIKYILIKDIVKDKTIE
jgi:adenosyl cobinamide kinase/adenosyl cobinamide phosphate guanylyltransferase